MQMREKVGKPPNIVFLEGPKGPKGRKIARRCGAKHISKSKCTKHTIVGPLLEVEMSKKCTPLWREAHVEVKMYKTPRRRTTFGSWDVEKVHAVKKVHAAVARTRFRSQNVQNIRVQTTFGGSDVASCGRCKGLCTLSKVSKTWGFCSIFNYNRHYTTLHSNTLQLQLQLHLHYIPLHYTPLHYTTPSYTQLHSITLHYMTIHSTTLRYTTLRYLPLRYITLHYTTLHYTPLHYAILHYATLTSTTLQLHYFTLHSTILQLQLHNYTPLHSTTLHYTPLH